MLEDGFAEDDENPGVHHGVEGRETKCQKVLLIVVLRADSTDKAKNLKDRKREKRCVMLDVKKLFKMAKHKALLNFYVSRNFN